MRLRALDLDAVLVAKVVLLVVTTALFTVLSWRMWPARVLASASELAQLRRSFAQVGAAMVACNLLNVALGVWHHALR
ncbi:MAG: hypothetical protein IAG13_38685 [Deltaproteobacteria bacterium]|nr:hypothetical protein [Nannocystaceae bacterium]